MNRLKIWTVIAMTSGLAFFAGCSAPPIKTEMNPVIVPHKANITMARIGIFSFRTPFQDPMLESQLAHHLHQLLLARRAARVVEVVPESYRDINEAIDRARVLGYDVAVMGQLQEAFWGGSVEPSKVTIDIRLVDTVRRITVWYLSSSARAEPRREKDFLLWRTDGARARTPMELAGRLLARMSDRLVYQTRRSVKVSAPFRKTAPVKAPPAPAPAPKVNPNYTNRESGIRTETLGPETAPLKTPLKPAG